VLLPCKIEDYHTTKWQFCKIRNLLSIQIHPKK